MSSNNKPVVVAIGAALAGGLALSGSAFAMHPLAHGYMLGAASFAADDKAAEASCGAGRMKEGGCDKAEIEGSCGMAKMDADKDGRISKAEFAAAHDGKDDKFAAHDPNGDGFMTAEEMKAHHAAMAGESKDDADKMTVGGKKTPAEGKCGEGKCGEGKCGSN